VQLVSSLKAAGDLRLVHVERINAAVVFVFAVFVMFSLSCQTLNNIIVSKSLIINKCSVLKSDSCLHYLLP